MSVFVELGTDTQSSQTLQLYLLYLCTILTYTGVAANLSDCEAIGKICHAHAECAKTRNSFTCVCLPGYSGDGLQCEDIDECTLGIHSCNVQAHCKNTPGSYSCVCMVGAARIYREPTNVFAALATRAMGKAA
ncbi:fibrillin-2-like [Tachysurus ichikawai]